jgi:hypothetical protein
MAEVMLALMLILLSEHLSTDLFQAIGHLCRCIVAAETDFAAYGIQLVQDVSQLLLFLLQKGVFAVARYQFREGLSEPVGIIFFWWRLCL